MGERLTWTSSGERKTATRRAGPTNRSAVGSTARTRPSAGDNTPPGTDGTSRSGSRKNPSEASAAAANGSARARRPPSARPAARTAGTAMNGQPSRATETFTRQPIRGGLIHDIMARSRLPTSSIGCSASRRRIARNPARLAWFSSTHSRANWPDWISARIRFISALVSALTTRGDAGPLREEVAHDVARRLGRDHGHVHIGRRHHLVEVDVEAVGEHEHLATAESALDLALEHLALALVGQQDHDHARHLGGLVDGRHAEPVLLGLRPALGALVEPHHDVLAGVLEVQRVAVALAAVADDRDLPALEQAEIGVRVVVDFRRHP